MTTSKRFKLQPSVSCSIAGDTGIGDNIFTPARVGRLVRAGGFEAGPKLSAQLERYVAECCAGVRKSTDDRASDLDYKPALIWIWTLVTRMTGMAFELTQTSS